MVSWVLSLFQKKKMIANNKQQVLDADPKIIEHINFTGNLDFVGNTTIFFTNLFWLDKTFV